MVLLPLDISEDATSVFNNVPYSNLIQVAPLAWL